MTHADRERNRLANTKMLDSLDEWLEGHQHDIERETYHQYKRYIDGRIRESFTPLDLTVKDLTGDEINEFYTYLRNAGLAGSSCQRYHGVLHKAFKDAVKRWGKSIETIAKPEAHASGLQLFCFQVIKFAK